MSGKRDRQADGTAPAAARPARGALALLGRLRRDVRANTLAIMAAALIPITAIAGSAVDMARTHVVRVRLQQACDAGVLAGRKFLISGTQVGVALTGAPLTQANTYFTNNLSTSWLGSGWYVANSPTFAPVTIADSQGNTQVAGTASVQVPMTLMQIFGVGTQTLSVACQASFSTPDTDVMFVLDTTGSMGCAVTRTEASCGTDWVPNNQANVTNSDGSTSYYVKEETSNGSNVSRIDALRQAVNAFYSTVANTKDASTNVRYGFVPYTSTVNVGSLLYNLNSSYLMSKWPYQSRTPTGDYVISTQSSKTVTAANQAACTAYYSRSPASRVDANTGDANAGYPNSGTATAYDPVWTPQTGNGTGSGNGNSPAKCTLNTDQVGPVWTYQGGVQYDASSFIAGNTIVDPSRVDGSKTTWNGCIEDRYTTPNTTSFDQNNLPPDLDPDLVPSSDSTRWRPLWADVTYARAYYTYNSKLYYLSSTWGTSTLNDNDAHVVPNYNDSILAQGGAMSCPAQAKALFLPDKATGATTISNYVSGLRAIGGTYHDVGMIWGTRMLSPTGIWKANNAWQSGRAAPKRVIVFVTDGTMSPSSSVYGAFGVEYPERRVTGTYFGSTTDPNSGRNSDGTCTDTSANCYAFINFHNQRFLAECARAKSSPLSYDVWVVEVAQASSPQLSACASRPSQVLVGQTTAQLTAAFKQIAAQVALLRVTQ